MLKLRDIMTRQLVTLSPEQSLLEAMGLLTSRHITGAPVVANGKVVGVISLTDLVEFVASTADASIEAPEAAEWPEWEVPRDVVEGEPLSAFFSHVWDSARTDVVDRLAQTHGNALEQRTVGEAMTRKVLALPPDNSVSYAANFMRRLGIHRVLVMKGEKLLGIVTTRDIADAVADYKLTSYHYVGGRPANSVSGS